MTPEREKYLHLYCCAEWLNDAWTLLHKILENRDNPLEGAALKLVSVLYAKPYKNSHGIHGRYRLDEKYVPAEHLELHRKLIADRDQLHAHTDLTRMEANVEPVHFPSGTHVSISRSITYTVVTTAQIERIIALVEGTLTAIDADLEHQEKQLR